MGLLALAMTFSVALPLSAAEPLSPERRAQAAKLLDGLPSRSDLYRAHDAIYKQGHTDAERQSALKLVEVARARIPKLRPLIVVGTNVFDYPGLLAAGETLFIRHSDAHPEIRKEFYRLFIGITELTGEGHIPNMFGIDFDETGRILTISTPGPLIR